MACLGGGDGYFGEWKPTVNEVDNGFFGDGSAITANVATTSGRFG
jgi:hypothetical protein